MNRVLRFLGARCDQCAPCRYARSNPGTLIGKIMTWHGKWCPAWKAQKLIEQERLEQDEVSRILLRVRGGSEEGGKPHPHAHSRARSRF